MLKLHFAPNSRAGRIVWLLEELELPCELNRMDFNPRDLKSDKHRAHHPLGRVPVLEDGDVTIYESGGIVEYVLKRYRNGGLKPAVDTPTFPAYLQWFHYCEGMVMSLVNTIVMQTLLLPPERRDENARGQAPAHQGARPGGRGAGRQGLPDRRALGGGHHARPRLLHEQRPRLCHRREVESERLCRAHFQANGIPESDGGVTAAGPGPAQPVRSVAPGLLFYGVELFEPFVKAAVADQNRRREQFRASRLTSAIA